MRALWLVVFALAGLLVLSGCRTRHHHWHRSDRVVYHQPSKRADVVIYHQVPRYPDARKAAPAPVRRDAYKAPPHHWDRRGRDGRGSSRDWDRRGGDERRSRSRR